MKKYRLIISIIIIVESIGSMIGVALGSVWGSLVRRFSSYKD